MLQAVASVASRFPAIANIAPTMAPVASQVTVDTVQPGGGSGMGPASSMGLWSNVFVRGAVFVGGSALLGWLLYRLVRK